MVDERQVEFVKSVVYAVLGAQIRQLYVVGSRARGTARLGSDLDLLIDPDKPLTLLQSAQLNERFEESDLPYSVDIIDGTALSPQVRARMMAGALKL